MKFLKILLGIIVVLALVVIAGSFVLPSEQHVERSIVVNADQADVFPMLNDYRKFNEWSPWATIDPDGTEYVFSGPDTGVGAKVSWRSEHPNVGNGEQEIVEAELNTMVKSRLTFEGFEEPSYATFMLEPADGGTRVTWSFDANLAGIIGPWMGLMMDNWVGADYERGLERLKEQVES